MDDQELDPVEQAPITIFDTVVLAVRTEDGTLWLSISDLAVAINVDPKNQRRRLRTNALLERHTREFRAPSAGGPQNQIFLRLEGVGLWVMTINANKVSDTIRDRLIWLQQHLESAVRKAFAEATGLPERSSDIEEIDDLNRVDHILQGLINQQGYLLRQQEDLARTVADLAERFRERERAQEHERALNAETAIISKSERGQIYNLVLSWSILLQKRHASMTIGAARATCWAAFKRKFQLAEYHHLPATRYQEAVDFIRAACRELGGGDLPAQAALDLGDH